MPNKIYHEKLNSPSKVPKIEDLSCNPESIKRFSGTKLLVAVPMQYHNIMAKIPEGRLIPADWIRAYLATGAGADTTCPLTARIFINIFDHASQ